MEFQRELFLGLFLDEKAIAHLNLIEPARLKLFFLQNSLQEMPFNGNRFLGRSIPSPVVFSELELLEQHLCSVLQLLFSDFNLPLQLFPIASMKGLP